MKTDDRSNYYAVPSHGTRARYVSQRSPCRCPDCTAANTRYMSLWRAGATGTMTMRVAPTQLEMFRGAR